MRVMKAEAAIQRYVERFDMARFLNEDMMEHLQLFHFPAYTNVFIEQDEQHTLYFLVEGQVQCSHYHLNGKLAVFALSNPFSAIGDVEILSEERIQSNVIATQDTIMLGIASDLVQRYGANDPRFLRFLIDQLKEKLFTTNALQQNQVLPVINRLILYLLMQSNTCQDGAITLPNKEGLASLLGTTTRHLNRVLKELVDSGSISDGYPCLRILDKAGLHDLLQ